MLRSIRVPYLANLFVVGALLASSSAARATPCAQFSGPCTYVPNPTDYPNVQSDVMGSFEFAAQPLTDDDVSSENGEDLDYWPTADQGDANDYLAYHYSGSTNPRLVVVLPGSGQTPGKYTHFMTRAAHHGFNVIGLMYKNDVPEVNCVDLHSNNVAECQYVQHRFDFQGTPIPTEYTGPNSPHMPLAGYAGVPGYNSVSHRLGQLLKYLNHNFPGQGWGRFLGADGESIAWNSGVIVVGHSHGGGVATFGAQANAFDRLIMFDSTPVTVDTDTPPSAVIFAKLDQPGGTIPITWHRAVTGSSVARCSPVGSTAARRASRCPSPVTTRW